MGTEAAAPAPGVGAAFDARVSADGRAVLGPQALALRTDLDRHFAGWGRQAGASAVAYPPVLAVDDLLDLDYFANFPHLASMVSGLRPEAMTAPAVKDGSFADQPGSYLGPATHVLPSAACYSAYLDLAGTVRSEPALLTTVATCFRREDRYDGLRRLFAFTMREIVCVGPREAVLDFLGTHKSRIASFIAEVGLPFEIAAATDPFFDPNGARSFMQKLFPVKEEFVYGGDLAIASVNFHRNFFGERCRILLDNGEPAFTGCVAFGLERWLAALSEHFGGRIDKARSALRASGEWQLD
jgi:hypothetical protein